MLDEEKEDFPSLSPHAFVYAFRPSSPVLLTRCAV